MFTNNLFELWLFRFVGRRQRLLMLRGTKDEEDEHDDDGNDDVIGHELAE